MAQPVSMDHLDDQTVLQIVHRFTRALEDQLPEDKASAIRSDEGARGAIAAVAGGLSNEAYQPEPALSVPRLENAAPFSRQILALLSEDEAIRPQIEALVNQPPTAKQAEAKQAEPKQVILHTVAAWLLTRAGVEVQHEKGQEIFQFSPERSDVDTEVIKDVIKATLDIITKL